MGHIRQFYGQDLQKTKEENRSRFLTRNSSLLPSLIPREIIHFVGILPDYRQMNRIALTIANSSILI